MSTSAAIDWQTSLFELLGVDPDKVDSLKSEDLEKVIKRLTKEKNKVKKLEKNEAKRKAAEEQEKCEREEREKHEAHVSAVTSMSLPVNLENAFFGDARAAEVHADSISDGLVLSLANLGKVDIEYIAAIASSDPKSVIQALRGSIYQNPEIWNECFYKGWETAEEYLSGNLMRKWKAAKKQTKRTRAISKPMCVRSKVLCQHPLIQTAST